MVLPSEFNSLYRLFLRATSAAVLHNGPATRGLRRLYRPSFEAAASAVRRLESLGKSSNEAENVRKWLARFDERINGTLSLFQNASHTRGLPHLIVSRLSFLSRTNYPWTIAQKFKERSWNPRLDPKAPEYGTFVKPGALRRAEMKKSEAEFNDKMWGALGEVVNMAEGRDGLVLGRVRFKRQEFRRKKFY